MFDTIIDKNERGEKNQELRNSTSDIGRMRWRCGLCQQCAGGRHPHDGRAEKRGR